MSNKLNVAAYVRESRDENFEKISTLNNQIKILQDYIIKQPEWKLYDIYADDNYSGTSFARPELNRLIKDAESGFINIILLKDLSRLGRNNGKTLIFLDWAEEHGIQVITTDGRYNSSLNNELVGLDTWFNERYAQDISNKIRSTLKMKIESGEYIGTAPYGYIKDVPGHLEPDPVTAVIVRDIYSMYMQGLGYKKICEELSKNKIPPPKTKWSPQTIKRILTSQVYIGTTVQGVSKKLSYKSKKTIRLPEKEWIITNKTHKEIINKYLFEKVQSEIKKRQYGQGNYKDSIPVFKNILFCGYCGKKMYSKGKGYICSQYVKFGSEKCKRNFNYTDKLIELTLEKLQDLIRKIKFENSTKDDIIYKAETKYKNRLELLYNDRLNGIISREKYIELSIREEDQYQKIKKQIKTNNVCIENLVKKFLNESKDTVSNDMIRELLRATVEKCIVK